MKKTILILTATLTLLGCAKKEHWKPLFNGKDLTGWTIRGGEATYEVVDGAIVGTTKLNTENTFLCSDSLYSDFILELDFKVDPKLNSGVQIRSNSYPEYRNGRVHGYQVEIDPDTVRKRYWTGGIYDEARRGWINDLSENEAAKNVFKHGDWNKFRIEAIGDTIKTFVNGVIASYIIDNTTPKGFIGLQVHSVGNDSTKQDIQVMWKNIRILTCPCHVTKNSTPVSIEPKVYAYNRLTEEEISEGWQLLFDGQTTTNWRGAYREDFPPHGWVIRDQTLTVLPSGGAESQNGGDIVTLEKYKNFELKVDFFFAEGANSGIKYYVTLQEKDNKGSAFGLEFQILDDVKHPDALLGRDGNRTVGSLYDLITADKEAPVKPYSWNQAHIIAKDNMIEHWLNGKKVVSFERSSKAYKALVAKSKYAAPQFNEAGPFGEAEEGYILLQDHGDLVSFRNIKIKVLN
jgi:hypothetical protein